MSLSLPERPHLDYLKAQAKELLAGYRAGDAASVDRVLPFFDAASQPGLSEMQLVIAREYGFDSWSKLKHHVELRAGTTLAERADRLATVSFRGDIADLHALIVAEPTLRGATPAAACATGDVVTVQRLLAERPGFASEKVGEKGWEPLLFVCYSCLLRDDRYRPALLQVARLLLDAGADPNASWHDDNWNADEACLYGATGLNDCLDLAKLLLDAGANPNDGESMYHSTEHADPACLRLLLERGGDVAETNVLAHLLDREEPDWLRMMLSFAKDPARIPPVIPHALRRGRSAEIFQILVEAGIPLNEPDTNGLTPYQSAIRLGRTDVAAILATAGAETTLTAADELIGRLALGERVDPATISADIIRQLDSESSPELVRQAERGNDIVLETLLMAGANPNVKDSYLYPLHQPAGAGRLSTIRILLKYGADPSICDTVHGGHAVGWACFGSANGPLVEQSVYVQIVEELLDAGGTLPETAWGSAEVQAALVRRGSKPATTK